MNTPKKLPAEIAHGAVMYCELALVAAKARRAAAPPLPLNADFSECADAQVFEHCVSCAEEELREAMDALWFVDRWLDDEVK
jgi:hypothetical protein